MNTGYAIPDIELQLRTGGTVSPADFKGHELIILFCPLDSAAAARELTDYDRYADQFSHSDAWMIAVCDDTGILPDGRTTVAADPGLGAWRAFTDGLEPPERPTREDGAVFLFGRGGCLTRTWPGSGHANEVAKELRRRV